MAFATSPRLFIAIPHPSFLLRAAEWSQASSLRASSATDAPNGSRSPALSAKRSLNVLLCPLWVISGKAQTEHIMSALPPKADIERHEWHVCFVPEAAVSRCSNTHAEFLTLPPARRGAIAE